ncbi:MAG: hypothetical protein ACREFD_11355 [Stellaceae bacterium]
MTVASPHHYVGTRRFKTRWLIEDHAYDSTTQGWGDGKGWGMGLILGSLIWAALLYFLI